MTKKPAAKKAEPRGRRRKSQEALPTGPLPESDQISFTITGPAHHVRRALTALRFEEAWNRDTTAQIALDETGVATATIDDKLGGPKLHMFNQDARDDYKQKCMDAASDKGHPIVRPDKIPAESDTTVAEVGDALFDNSRS